MNPKNKIFPAVLAASIISLSAFAVYFVLPRFTKYHLSLPGNIFKRKDPIVDKTNDKKELERIKQKALQLEKFCKNHEFSNQYGFIADLREHSGKKRLFVFDYSKDSIVASGMVAHGSCNQPFLSKAKFSNTEGCGCSSVGKYKIGGTYKGRFGNAFKLHGLDTTNSNAYNRNIVLHAYDCIPDEPFFPQPICNSLGCAMVSYNFLQTLSGFVVKSKKPVVLWILD